jgi:hypothetical protein
VYLKVAGEADVKRACMAAGNVDGAGGHSNMLVVLDLDTMERPWRLHAVRVSVLKRSEQHR